MKNMKLPDSDEWNRIVDDAFSSDEIHTFSENYNMKKQSMRKGITMKKNNLMMNLTVAAAALAVVAFPTGIYLSTRTAETQPAAEIPSEETTDAETPVEIINNETIYALEMGWLPEGLENQQENEAGINYGYSDTEIKLTVLFMKSPDYTPVENITYHDNTVSTDVKDTENKKIVINYNASYDEEAKNPDNSGREIFVAFKDTKYFAHLFVTDDISEDDLNKIITEMKLVPSDTETAKDYVTSSQTEVEISDGVDDGQVNEDTQEFTEEDTENNIDYDTIYDVEYGWLPEGLEYQGQDSPYGGKFHNWTTDDGMTPAFAKVPEGVQYYEDTGNPEIEATMEEWSLDGKTVSIYYRSTYIPDNPEHNFGRVAFIYFDNTPYVLQLFVTDGISKEDFRKIIDNVKLVPSDKETAYIYQPETEEIEDETTEYDPYHYYFREDECTVYQVGDEIPEYDLEEKGDISIKVNDVHFQDNFDGITTNRHNEYTDFSQYLDENGKVAAFKINWLDENYEAVAYESLPCHVMVLNLTYTNNDDETIEYMIGPQMQHRYNGYFCPESVIWEMEEMPKHPEYFSSGYDKEDLELKWDFTYFSISTDKYGDFENIVLEPGESTDVQLAFIVRDDLRDNLYLNINGYLPENNSKHLLDLSNIE